MSTSKLASALDEQFDNPWEEQFEGVGTYTLKKAGTQPWSPPSRSSSKSLVARATSTCWPG